MVSKYLLRHVNVFNLLLSLISYLLGLNRSHSQSRKDSVSTVVGDIKYKPPPIRPMDRQYFVLTHAGKPVFTVRKQEEVDTGSEEVTNLIGVMHALISVFEDDQDKIR